MSSGSNSRSLQAFLFELKRFTENLKAYGVPALDATLEDIQSLFSTNLFSVMIMCKEFSPLLIAAKGKIVNIGSVAGIIPLVLIIRLAAPPEMLTTSFYQSCFRKHLVCYSSDCLDLS